MDRSVSIELEMGIDPWIVAAALEKRFQGLTVYSEADNCLRYDPNVIVSEEDLDTYTFREDPYSPESKGLRINDNRWFQDQQLRQIWRFIYLTTDMDNNMTIEIIEYHRASRTARVERMWDLTDRCEKHLDISQCYKDLDAEIRRDPDGWFFKNVTIMRGGWVD
ncbi:hypothetical protein HDU89_008146 [Geranomyces variabilis]|nr:hypothetical protein HDU89_008146 [Geranomyces variabilis]